MNAIEKFAKELRARKTFKKVEIVDNKIKAYHEKGEYNFRISSSDASKFYFNSLTIINGKIVGNWSHSENFSYELTKAQIIEKIELYGK